LTVHLAIISDLHVGTKARRHDLRPGHPPESWPAPYIEEFRDFVQAEHLTAEYLLLPGDISNQASPEEYRLAAEKIVAIADMLKCPREHIVLVPGNHDVCWPVQRLGGSFWQAKKFLPMYEILTPGLGLDSKDYEPLFNPPYAVVKELGDLLFVLVNSACKDDYVEPGTGGTKPHHGSFALESAKHLCAQVDRIRGHRPKFAILLTHHHVLPMTDPDPYWEDFSMMNNSDILFDFIAKAGIDLVVHGHKHWPRFRPHHEAPRSLVTVLSAGSFSAEIHESLSAKVFNKFHVAELRERDMVGNACGFVWSWSYYGGHGWKRSVPENGITHKEPFGYYRQAEEVLTDVRHAHATAKDSTTGPLELAAILARVPNADYIPDQMLDEAVVLLVKEVDAQLLTDSASGKRYIYHG
jgi:UDP-2,3-diacylglucosamine pyrophosphatase LpxH